MNSKIDLRAEAVRMASRLEGVSLENITEAAEKIEKYIIGDITFPDVMDMKEMMKAFTDLQGFKPDDYVQKEMQGLSFGMPKSAE